MKTILIVDVEIPAAESIRNKLQKLGYSTLTARSAMAAISMIKEYPSINLVLMDITLGSGGLDGTEAARLILSTKDIPIIFISTHSEDEIIYKTEEVTSYGYILKDAPSAIYHTSINMAFELFEAYRKTRESEELYRSIVKANVDGYLLLNSRGKILDVNDAYCKMSGYLKDELLNLSIFNLEAEETESEIQNKLQRIAQTGQTHFESGHKRKDGGYYPVEISVTYLSAPNQLFIAFIRNISGRKKMEKDAVNAKLFIDNISDIAYETDTNGNIIFINAEIEKKTGIPVKEISGKPFINLLREEDGYSFVQFFHRALKGEKMEEMLTLTNEISCHFTILPKYGAGGKITGTFGIARDITEKLKSEELLKMNESEYRALFENMDSGFALHQIVKNEEGRPIDYKFLKVNNAFYRLTGLDNSIISQNVTQVIPGIENDNSNWIQRYAEVAEKGETIQFESYSEILDRWYSVTAYSPKPGMFATLFYNTSAKK